MLLLLNGNKMRTLILHANKFESKIVSNSNRPYGIKPEDRDSSIDNLEDGLVILFCVENDDTTDRVDALYNEIIKTSSELKINKLMISPFVHLSKNIAKPEIAKQLYYNLLSKFENTNFVIKTSAFGYNKSLLLDVKGHPGSFRYREF